MSRTKTNVNFRRRHYVNLHRAVADAVKVAPIKELAREFDCTPREIAELRTELRLPRVPLFLEIAKRDPALKAMVEAILSGEGEAASPQNFDALIRKLGAGQ